MFQALFTVNKIDEKWQNPCLHGGHIVVERRLKKNKKEMREYVGK